MPLRPPQVSILLPTFNRARFLPEAFKAIASQTLTNWELIVVDDGSTDQTEGVVAEIGREWSQPVRYVRQPNAGAYGARNTALDLATAPLIAFYDSDDLWLPHHLSDCVRALDANSDVAWVYAACRIVNYGTGQEIDPNTFLVNGEPRPFTELRRDMRGALAVFDDERTAAWAVRHGLYCGLQNSVIRQTVFEGMPFQSAFRNEAEDQLFVIRALKRNFRLAYLNAVHVQYHVHDANSSSPDSNQSVDRQLRVYEPLVRGFEELRTEFEWTPLERRELARRIGQDCFWHIGYAILWQGARYSEALDAYRRGLRSWPWSLAWWKTYWLARCRVAVGLTERKHTA